MLQLSRPPHPLSTRTCFAYAACLLAGLLAALLVDASQIALLLMGRLAPIGINCLAMLLPGLQASQNEDVSATSSVCVCSRCFA